ncbi:RPL27A [Symbiodinium pilosum]|uniref:RPL27A protein n=1 Tax=Symbiodinium pilosum TaxID=2952 RepID=A0A812VUQ7_SYMPI|nr:RPL27A [Symbiodinium pilosum]
MTTRFKKNRKMHAHRKRGHGRIGKHRKHPGGCGNSGGQHHHRINFDKYHPGYFGKVGMRNFHLIKHGKVIPTINVERLWSLVSEQTRLFYKDKTDKAPVIDVLKAGYMKVLGKGQLPEQPVIVKARYFTKEAEEKIKAAGSLLDLVLQNKVVCAYCVPESRSNMARSFEDSSKVSARPLLLPQGTTAREENERLREAPAAVELRSDADAQVTRCAQTLANAAQFSSVQLNSGDPKATFYTAFLARAVHEALHPVEVQSTQLLECSATSPLLAGLVLIPGGAAAWGTGVATPWKVVELPGASAHVLELTECFVESVGEVQQLVDFGNKKRAANSKLLGALPSGKHKDSGISEKWILPFGVSLEDKPGRKWIQVCYIKPTLFSETLIWIEDACLFYGQAAPYLEMVQVTVDAAATLDRMAPEGQLSPSQTRGLEQAIEALQSSWQRSRLGPEIAEKEQAAATKALLQAQQNSLRDWGFASDEAVHPWDPAYAVHPYGSRVLGSVQGLSLQGLGIAPEHCEIFVGDTGGGLWLKHLAPGRHRLCLNEKMLDGTTPELPKLLSRSDAAVATPAVAAEGLFSVSVAHELLVVTRGSSELCPEALQELDYLQIASKESKFFEVGCGSFTDFNVWFNRGHSTAFPTLQVSDFRTEVKRMRDQDDGGSTTKMELRNEAETTMQQPERPKGAVEEKSFSAESKKRESAQLCSSGQAATPWSEGLNEAARRQRRNEEKAGALGDSSKRTGGSALIVHAAAGQTDGSAAAPQFPDPALFVMMAYSLTPSSVMKTRRTTFLQEDFLGYAETSVLQASENMHGFSSTFAATNELTAPTSDHPAPKVMILPRKVDDPFFFLRWSQFYQQEAVICAGRDSAQSGTGPHVVQVGPTRSQLQRPSNNLILWAVCYCFCASWSRIRPSLDCHLHPLLFIAIKGRHGSSIPADQQASWLIYCTGRACGCISKGTMTTRFKKSRKMHAHRKRGPAPVALQMLHKPGHSALLLKATGASASTESIRAVAEIRVDSTSLSFVPFRASSWSRATANGFPRHHHRINFDKYHPGYFGKVGMRNFHLIKHSKVIPTINVERLWSLVSEQTRLFYKDKTDKAPVIDVMKAGYMKVLGKGQLPEQPVIVKARTL